MGSELTTVERKARLAELQGIIANGMATFIAVGEAIAAVRDEKLYLEDGCASFEDYCNDRLGISKWTAYRRITVARVTKSTTDELHACNELETSKVDDKPAVLPASQRQATELAKVEPARRQEVMQSAASSGPVTAPAIRQAAARPPLCNDCRRKGAPGCGPCRAAYARSLPSAADMAARAERRSVTPEPANNCTTVHVCRCPTCGHEHTA